VDKDEDEDEDEEKYAVENDGDGIACCSLARLSALAFGCRCLFGLWQWRCHGVDSIKERERERGWGKREPHRIRQSSSAFLYCAIYFVGTRRRPVRPVGCVCVRLSVLRYLV